MTAEPGAPTAPDSAAAARSPAPLAAVRTTGLSKRFGRRLVVDTLDLEVPSGAVYGFLGPNGSGKTTSLRMILGLVRPTAGTIALLGDSLPGGALRALPRVGSLVEGPAFHPYLSGRANLRRLDAADRIADPRTSARRIDAALERVGLLAAAGKRFRHYSLGMRQRLGIAAALLMPRDLLVLDEPTNGLDPQGTREVRSLIGSLGADGITVLVSSHLLSEIEQVCTHVGVISAGRLVAQGPVADVIGAQQTTVEVHTSAPDAAGRVLTDHGMTGLRRTPVTVTAIFPETPALPEGSADGAAPHAAGESAGREAGAGEWSVRPEELVAALVAAGVPVRGFTVRTPSLEDVFVGLTGEGFDVEQ